MTEPRELIAYMHQGTALFDRVLSGLSDRELEEGPSALPGWGRRHVVAHVGYNARALSRLVQWARTGVENPMYSDSQARNAEIEHGAALSAAELRSLASESAERLSTDLAELPSDRWDAQVVTAQGRTVPAAEIPWMRCREVWIHAVDLGGASFADLPAGMVDALARDVLVLWERRGQGVDMALRASDRPAGWPGAAVPGAGQSPVSCHGSAAELTAWLTGRASSPAGTEPEGATAPELPRWL